MPRIVSRIVSRLVLLGAALVLAGLSSPPAAAQAASPDARVAIIYEETTNPAHRALRTKLMELQVLEQARKFYLVFKLPRPITLKAVGCDGEADAWFADDEVTICYEYLQYIGEAARSRKRPSWTDERSATLGPLLDVILHEGAHMVFALFNVPLLGREEDAADAISAFAMLNLYGADARPLVAGIAYTYLSEAGAIRFKRVRKLSRLKVDGKKLADSHSTPLQRMYNILCLAYGHDAATYADVVSKGTLPQDRADGCAEEYEQVGHAFRTLILPHIDDETLRELVTRSATPRRR